MKTTIICILIVAVIFLILFFVLKAEIKRNKKLDEKLKKSQEEIEQRKRYEMGVKEDNEKLNKVNSGSKLSNFNAGLDMLRDK